MDTVKHIRIAIKPSTHEAPELCAVCGSDTEPQKPFDLYLDSTSQIVCRRCAAKHAPDLVSLMDYFYRGHYVEPEYEEIENELNSIKALAEGLSTDDLEMLEENLRRLSKQSYVLRKFIADRTGSDQEEPF